MELQTDAARLINGQFILARRLSTPERCRDEQAPRGSQEVAPPLASASSEAHDSGLCAVDADTRKLLAPRGPSRKSRMWLARC